MVGDEVEDEAEIEAVQGCEEALIILGRAELRIEAVMVGDVVAVTASGARFQER